MTKLDWKETIELAHAIANLPSSEEFIEAPEISEMLGMEVTYSRGLFDNEGYLVEDTEPTLLVEVDGCSIEYIPVRVLQTFGSWNEALTRLITDILDKASSPYWERDRDLSALFGYGMDNSDRGVFYHCYDEGIVELSMNHLVYNPFEFLSDQFHMEW